MPGPRGVEVSCPRGVEIPGDDRREKQCQWQGLPNIIITFEMRPLIIWKFDQLLVIVMLASIISGCHRGSAAAVCQNSAGNHGSQHQFHMVLILFT